MNAKESARHNCMFGRRQRSDGQQGEGGEQLVLDCFNTDSAQDDTTTDPRYATAKRRAAQAMERIRECPEIINKLRAFCEDYASKGRRIEAHAAAGYLKNHSFVNHSTGQDFDLDNNHLPFFLRILAAENPNIAEHLKLRTSMFDLLNLQEYVNEIQKFR